MYANIYTNGSLTVEGIHGAREEIETMALAFTRITNMVSLKSFANNTK